MRSGGREVFVLNASAFESVRTRLKLTPCPACRSVGHLICHGFLRGYAETGSDRILRGRRFFCSNRGRRRGGGSTFSILVAKFLRRLTLTAATLWRFLLHVRRGAARSSAWKSLGLSRSPTTPYRLLEKILQNQPRIRTRLSRILPPPPSTSSNPLEQTLLHLERAFPLSREPIVAFQGTLQEAFLR